MTPPALRAAGVAVFVLYGASTLLLAAMAVPAVAASAPAFLAPWAAPESPLPLVVHAVIAVAAALAWRARARRTRRTFTIPAVAVAGVSVVVLGLASYGPCQVSGQSPAVLAIIRAFSLLSGSYDTGMFGVEPGCAAGVPPALQIARLTMLAAIAIGAFGAVAALLGRHADRVVVRAARKVDLVVGLDDSGMSLLAALASRRGDGVLAVLAEDPAASWVSSARRLGARVVAMDRDDRAGLAALLRRRSRTALRSLAALDASASANIAAVEAVREAVGAEGPRREPVRVLVRIDDPWQAEEWRRGVDAGEGWLCDAIGAHEVLAAEVADRLEGVGTVLVVGRGPFPLALLAELDQRVRERVALDETARRGPEVLLLGPRAPELLEEHRLRAARFGNDAGFGMAAVAGEGGLDEVLAAGDAAGHGVALVVAEDDEGLATAAAVRRPEWPVLALDLREQGIAPRPTVARLTPVGPTVVAGTGVPIDAWERVARLAHEHYRRRRGDTAAESARPWDGGLPAFYRESNVRQVLAALRGAVVIGRTWGAASAPPSLPDSDELERLAALEHQSWCAQYRAAGWRFGPRRDTAARRHPDLVAWRRLPDDRRAATRDGVAATFALLWALGYRSRRAEEQEWSRYTRQGVVTAVRREEAWEWQAHDGSTMSAGAGHWDVEDGTGSRWSVEPEVFAATYRHLEGDRYARVGEVDARRMPGGGRVETLEGPVDAQPGDWLLRGAAGELWPVAAERFSRDYRPVEDADGGV